MVRSVVFLWNTTCIENTRFWCSASLVSDSSTSPASPFPSTTFSQLSSGDCSISSKRNSISWGATLSFGVLFVFLSPVFVALVVLTLSHFSSKCNMFYSSDQEKDEMQHHKQQLFWSKQFYSGEYIFNLRRASSRYLWAGYYPVDLPLFVSKSFALSLSSSNLVGGLEDW